VNGAIIPQGLMIAQ